MDFEDGMSGTSENLLRSEEKPFTDAARLPPFYRGDQLSVEAIVVQTDVSKAVSLARATT